MGMDYTRARIGETCAYCGGKVRVISAKRLLRRAAVGNNRKTRVCVCRRWLRRLSQADQAGAARHHPPRDHQACKLTQLLPPPLVRAAATMLPWCLP